MSTPSIPGRVWSWLMERDAFHNEGGDPRETRILAALNEADHVKRGGGSAAMLPLLDGDTEAVKELAGYLAGCGDLLRDRTLLASEEGVSARDLYRAAERLRGGL